MKMQYSADEHYVFSTWYTLCLPNTER